MRLKIVASLASLCISLPLLADDPPLVIDSLANSNAVRTLRFSPVPAINQYSVRGSGEATGPFSNAIGTLNGFTFTATNPAPSYFYSLAAAPMSSNAVLAANVLNRLAYGPTPDELERLAAIGAQAYIDEQLSPEAITETSDSWSTVTTNGVPSPSAPQWQFVSFRGTLLVNTASNLYLYLTGPGTVYIDDISLVTVDTNGVESPNLLENGDFEMTPVGTFPPRWNVTANMIASSVTTEFARSG